MRCYLYDTSSLGFVSSLFLQIFIYVSVASELSEQKDSASTTSVLIANGTIIKNGTTDSRPDHSLNSTNSLPDWMRTIESGALQRAGYVVLGIMSIILIFFAVRSIRLHHKRSKSRKYGIIVSNASEMEMEPLDHNDDEEEEMTLFDAHHKHLLK